MTMNVGRVALKTPTSVNYVSRNQVDEGLLVSGMPNPALVGTGSDGYLCKGREHGATAQSLMDALVLERKRQGAIYVSDDSGSPVVPAGYYAIEDCNYEKPSGAPRKRPWTLQLTKVDAPLVARQAESDNVAGADTADVAAEEASKVVYTPTTSEVLVLDPRNVAGAEKLNLPAGTYRVLARAYQATNSSGKLRLTTTQLDGTTLTAGAQVAIGTPDAWVEVDLGSFTIATAYGGANWFTLKVHGVAAELGDVSIDRLTFAPA